MNSLKVYSVQEITRYIQDLIKNDPNLAFIWVRGEISELKVHSSGHMYFVLKDEAARLRGVMFRSRVRGLRFKPAAGMEIFVLGYIGLYERNGEYQIYAEEMLPSGPGELYVAFNELKSRLQAEGLFDVNKKRPIPPYPDKIAIVTSPTGAAIKDIITVSKRRFPPVELLIVPTLVQGKDAPEEIVKALRRADASGADVIILARGGGSAEELWCFNDERIARAIRTCVVPVVSAVGHETDYTIADFAADMRAPTPSAGAEMLVPDIRELMTSLNLYEQRLFYIMRRRIELMQERLQSIQNRRIFLRPKEMIDGMRMDLDRLQERKFRAIQGRIDLEKENLKAISEKLALLNPLSTLNRGYSVTYHFSSGELIRNIKQVMVGEIIEVMLTDGSIICKVNEKKVRDGIE